MYDYVKNKLTTDPSFQIVDTRHGIVTIDSNNFINGEPTYGQIMHRIGLMWISFDDIARTAI